MAEKEEVKEAEKVVSMDDAPKGGGSDDSPSNSAIEQIAAKIGWRKDYGGEDAVDAETFILKTREIQNGLNQHVKALNKKLDSMDEGISAMRSFYERTHEEKVSQLRSEIDRLRAEREEAVEDGDKEKFKKIENKIQSLEKEASKAIPVQQKNTPTPEYIEWAEKNKWYETDSEMRSWADAYYQVAPELKGLSRKRLLKTITDKAKAIFPDKFEDKTSPKDTNTTTMAPAQRAAAVSPSTTRSKSKIKWTADKLSYHQRKTGEQFVSMRVFENLDQYAQEVQKEYERGN